MVTPEDLRRAEELHGHLCPFLVIGMRAAEIAMEKLGVEKLGVYESIHEEVVAIVEVNNCFSDGVQVKTGCTLGNNSLVYVDLGKNAVTLALRGSSEGVRVYFDSEKIGELVPSEARELRRKVLVERTASREEVERFHELWRKAALSLVDLPESYFKVSRVRVLKLPERSPIVESVKCRVCGELVMTTKTVERGGGRLCLYCAGARVPVLAGRGILLEVEPRELFEVRP
ncbi:MAG: FmdE family protein [Acidilobaceae archaeon]